MPFALYLRILILVIVAGAVTTYLAGLLARLSVFQQMLVLDGAKVALSLLIIFLCLRLLTVAVRR